MSDFRPRIVGGEMEYNFHFKLPNGDVDIMREEVKSALSRNLPEDVLFHKSDGNGLRIDHFLENGSRYYADLNFLLEYAGPECDSFSDAVLYDIAADNYVIDHINTEKFKSITTDSKIFKRVSDHGLHEHTSGAHENYFLEELDAYHDFRIKGIALHGLASHLITRSIFTGAGSTDNEGRFHKTQKLRNLEQLVEQKTTGKKPIVNLRNEPLSSVGSRMHVVAGDANISPWAIWMKYGTTSLVLRLIENDSFPERAELNNNDMVSIARAVGSSASLTTIFYNKLGEKVTALDIQEIICEQSEKLGNKYQLPSEEYEVITEWAEVIDDLKKDQNKCLDRIDWLQSLHVVELAKEDTDLRHKRDLGYTMLHPNLGFGAKLREAGYFRKTPCSQAIRDAKSNPPQNTRGIIRSEAVRILSESNIAAKINWDYIRVLAPRVGSVDFKMSDPYENDVSKFYAWLEDTL